jgi:hypothetical protein
VEEVAGSSQVLEKLERETGVEPATSSLGSWHSTTELLPPFGVFNRSITTTAMLEPPYFTMTAPAISCPPAAPWTSQK